MKRLLLLGGGHAHVHVLQALAAEPLAAAQVTLVSPYRRQVYSGMVPGLLAGHYGIDDCVIPLAPLAAAAGARFIQASATALDADAQRVTLSTGDEIDFDLLAIDTGPVMPVDAIAGAREHGWPVRPIEIFIGRWQALLDAERRGPCDLFVVGGGAAGVELAMAIAHRFGDAARVSVVTGGGPVLGGSSAGLQRRVTRALQRRDITVIDDSCSEIGPESLRLASGRLLACDLAVLALGASAAPWLAASGLQCNAQGFVETGPTLQSVSHPAVFAAGDVSSRVDVSHPKSGVYAVRAGPPLAFNLRCAVDGGELRQHLPQRHSLALLACGERHAIASWNGWSFEGDWVWRWKDHIDRAFISRYTLPER
ncbi:FAD-dependent oxidoreductase [Piscinibacter sakaiensis]|uniref:FAD-dependent oxidoreductase n=1 Tax=Piscinibacter sakaiensis TaxID=1547922 RepID=UPI003AAA2948